mmetsp:Transcript_2531/g.5268  ORF Transcript_2531/g.5268 Transcript_2531/m.5268 type:complete len:130 (+) Transcript_2531:108-497(+)|eukprot:CAMPEP_0118926586 /NCGR_PEP_ID=MMETSP1169-20130426/4238_1 /TAXON_ID=36882 /ORGANISM="Pyramimonas obovata, Strain CCMP722" /LENGTH=129 /DNA_ID=CAMNT_0006868161 /DNA_START=108 /DNA_END=497 /DNA_ORIENTATION=-
MALRRASSVWRGVISRNSTLSGDVIVSLRSSARPLPYLSNGRTYTSEATEVSEQSKPVTKYPDLTVEQFLEAAGGHAFPNLKKAESNFETVDQILVAESGTLKRFGMGVKERKVLRKMVERFKQGLWSP